MMLNQDHPPLACLMRCSFPMQGMMFCESLACIIICKNLAVCGHLVLVGAPCARLALASVLCYGPIIICTRIQSCLRRACECAYGSLFYTSIDGWAAQIPHTMQSW